MAIHTTVTIEQGFQVMDSIAGIPPGNTEQSYTEEGLTQIPIGANIVTVYFATPKASTDYEFEVLEVQNTTDADPFILAPEITEFLTTEFIVQFNGAPDTGAYFLRWKVAI